MAAKKILTAPKVVLQDLLDNPDKIRQMDLVEFLNLESQLLAARNDLEAVTGHLADGLLAGFVIEPGRFTLAFGEHGEVQVREEGLP